jgi:GTP-binding protein EngB required for normal cell division
MYCLLEYPRDKIPVENQLLLKQLWDSMSTKYGIRYTSHLLSKIPTENNLIDLWCDIECRRRHLVNLISTLERYSRWTQAHHVMTDAHIMAEKLLDIVTRLKEDSTTNMNTCQSEYKQVISMLDEDDDNNGVGSLYIRVCERLLADISDAEFYRAFSTTHAKMVEWNCTLASTDHFQPQILDLLLSIENDLNDQWSNHRYGIVRAKIGIIGYTCVGKSTILNRLLGTADLTSDESSPVRSIKSTYYQLQFDRKEPLLSPDNRLKATAVTLVDIQGHDNDAATVDSQIEPGNYLDEIRKADCDIYILVFDERLRYEQQGWITYIEQTLKRQCILVRSKVDIDFLAKFRERSGICFGNSTATQRDQFTPTIIEQLRFDNEVEFRQVYLTAADYMPASSDAELLLKDQSFDMKMLFDELGRLASDARNRRLHALAMRAVARVINICFRRGYVLNVFNYKIGAGVAALVPFGDQLPRYLARDHIRQAFGVTKDFRHHLIQFHLCINDGCLQTSIFENCVTGTLMKSRSDNGSLGAAVGGAIMASAPFSDDILRAAAPTAVVLTGAARIALTASTAILGVIISGAVCAWSAINSGKHIFGYVNRLCDDFILVSNPLIATIIDINTKKYEQTL